MPRTQGKILVIAGSDSGGGAGIQADIKTITTLGSYAATAITALTAQNTEGVFAVHPVPVDFVKQQAQVVLNDIGADVIKTGMLHTKEIINCVADLLEEFSQIPLILDPVMISTSGSKLLEDDAISALKERLISKSFIITPNLPEAAALLNLDEIIDEEAAAKEIHERYSCQYVLLKGGHSESDMIEDILYDGKNIYKYNHKRINTTSTHGTGCTLASAISTFIAQGYSVNDSVEIALKFVENAIKNAPGFGKGNGPLCHSNQNDLIKQEF